MLKEGLGLRALAALPLDKENNIFLVGDLSTNYLYGELMLMVNLH